MRQYGLVLELEARLIRTILILLFVSYPAFAQDEELQNPCIRDVKQVTQQAHLWPGMSKKTKSRGWLVQKFFRPNSFYEKIGLVIGDIILEVNGIKANPTDPQDPAIAELYRIEGNKPNKVKIEREGAMESVIYTCPYK